MLDFPDDTADGNPPANAGNVGLTPSPGRLHMPWGSQARVLQLLSCALEPTRLSPRREAHAPRLESSPCLPQLEKVCKQRVSLKGGTDGKNPMGGGAWQAPIGSQRVRHDLSDEQSLSLSYLL